MVNQDTSNFLEFGYFIKDGDKSFEIQIGAEKMGKNQYPYRRTTIMEPFDKEPHWSLKICDQQY